MFEYLEEKPEYKRDAHLYYKVVKLEYDVLTVVWESVVASFSNVPGSDVFEGYLLLVF